MILRVQSHLEKAAEFEAKAEQAAHDSKKRIFREMARTHRTLADSIAQSHISVLDDPAAI